MGKFIKRYPGFRKFDIGGKETGIQTTLEKVASTVATFLPEGGGGVQVSGIQMVSGKVPLMVGTFLSEGCGFQVLGA